MNVTSQHIIKPKMKNKETRGLEQAEPDYKISLLPGPPATPPRREAWIHFKDPSVRHDLAQSGLLKGPGETIKNS